MGPKASKTQNYAQCDSLLIGKDCTANTFPYIEAQNSYTQIEHEASTSRIAEEQLFYLMSRGLSEEEATSMIVAGFVEEFTKTLPMEYAMEFNKLIELNMIEAGAVG